MIKSWMISLTLYKEEAMSKTVKQGNIFFDKNGNVVRYGGNLGNSIMAGTVEKIYAKVEGDKSNDAYAAISFDKKNCFFGPSPKITKYHKFDGLNQTLKVRMLNELYMAFATNCYNSLNTVDSGE